MKTSILWNVWVLLAMPVVWRREEDVERRQQGRQSLAAVGDKGGQNSKGMYGLGLGFDIELKKLPTDLMTRMIDDGLPTLS